MSAVSLELPGEPVAPGHAAIRLQVVTDGTRIESPECDKAAGRFGPSHPDDPLRARFMNHRLVPPRPDIRNRVGATLLRLLNPLTRRLISIGLPTGAPNVLLTTRGRQSRKLRTVPLGLVVLDGRWFVQGTYGQGGWVGNLRVDAEATVTHPGGRRVPVHAVELSPEEAGAVLWEALQRFRRSRLLCWLLGPRFRPPIGVLWTLKVRVDDKLEDYVATARRNPLFELRPEAGADPVPEGPG